MTMLSDQEDITDIFTSKSKNLSALFKAETPAKTTNLKSKPKRQPDDTESTTPFKETSQIQNKNGAILFVSYSPVDVFMFEKGAACSRGKAMCCILNNSKQQQHDQRDSNTFMLLLYRTLVDTVTNVKIDSNFNAIIQEHNYIAFLDDRNVQWTFRLKSEEEVKICLTQLAICRALKQTHSKTVIQELPGGAGATLSVGDEAEVILKKWVVDGNAKINMDSSVSSSTSVTVGSEAEGWQQALIGARENGSRIAVVTENIEDSESQLVVYQIKVDKILDKTKNIICDAETRSQPDLCSSVDVDKDLVCKATNSTVQSSKKSSILSRIAKVGQPLIPGASLPKSGLSDTKPMNSIAELPRADLPDTQSLTNSSCIDMESDVEDVGVNNYPAISPKPTFGASKFPKRHLDNITSPSQPLFHNRDYEQLPTKTYAYNQPYIHAQKFSPTENMVVPRAPSQHYIVDPNILSQSVATDHTLSLLLAESRNQNTELRIQLAKVVDKLNNLTNMVDDRHTLSYPDSSFTPQQLLHSITSIVSQNSELKQELKGKYEALDVMRNKNQRLLEEKSELLSLTLEQKQNLEKDESMVYLQLREFKNKDDKLRKEKEELEKGMNDWKEKVEKTKELEEKIEKFQTDLQKSQDKIQKLQEQKQMLILKAENLQQEKLKAQEELKDAYYDFEQERKSESNVNQLKATEEKCQSLQQKHDDKLKIIEDLEESLKIEKKANEDVKERLLQILKDKEKIESEFERIKNENEELKKLLQEDKVKLQEMRAKVQRNQETESKLNITEEIQNVTKTVMNRVYQVSKKIFEKEEKYKGAYVRKELLRIIREETLRQLEDNEPKDDNRETEIENNENKDKFQISEEGKRLIHVPSNELENETIPAAVNRTISVDNERNAHYQDSNRGTVTEDIVIGYIEEQITNIENDNEIALNERDNKGETDVDNENCIDSGEFENEGNDLLVNDNEMRDHVILPAGNDTNYELIQGRQELYNLDIDIANENEVCEHEDNDIESNNLYADQINNSYRPEISYSSPDMKDISENKDSDFKTDVNSDMSKEFINSEIKEDKNSNNSDSNINKYLNISSNHEADEAQFENSNSVLKRHSFNSGSVRSNKLNIEDDAEFTIEDRIKDSFIDKSIDTQKVESIEDSKSACEKEATKTNDNHVESNPSFTPCSNPSSNINSEENTELIHAPVFPAIPPLPTSAPLFSDESDDDDWLS